MEGSRLRVAFPKTKAISFLKSTTPTTNTNKPTTTVLQEKPQPIEKLAETTAMTFFLKEDVSFRPYQETSVDVSGVIWNKVIIGVKRGI